MHILFAQIQADLRSNDALRQSAAGRDSWFLAKSAAQGIVASLDLSRFTRLTPDLWDIVSAGVWKKHDFPDSDVTAAAISIPVAVPSYRLGKLINDCHKEISAMICDFRLQKLWGASWRVTIS
ncbi:hypothetical protein OROHE_009550 [Orobanche hederae]